MWSVITLNCFLRKCWGKTKENFNSTIKFLLCAGSCPYCWEDFGLNFFFFNIRLKLIDKYTCKIWRNLCYLRNFWMFFFTVYWSQGRKVCSSIVVYYVIFFSWKIGHAQFQYHSSFLRFQRRHSVCICLIMMI